MDIYEELLGLVDLFEQVHIGYAICGGLALAVHGHPRATTDIDLLVAEEDLEPLLAAVGRLGFKFPALPMTFDPGTPREQRVLRVSKVSGEETMTLDLLVVGPSLEEVWAGRTDYGFADRSITVVSRDGLARMKRMAGRPQDLADLAAMGVDRDSEVKS